MSVPPNSATYMSQAFRTGTEERESFHKFFECWLVEQNQHLQELLSASKNHQDLNSSSSSSSTRTESTQGNEERVLRPLIDRVIKHYECYYQAKSRWSKQDVLIMFSPSWTSTLEDTYLWIAGWRPSMAFHLLYSKSGLQLERRLAELILGLTTGDLTDILPYQINRIDELQMKTIKEEKEVTEEMARQQETVADPSMVELSHVVTELMMSGEANGDRVGMEDQVESTLAPKEVKWEEILQRADDLRLRTLKGVIDILRPTQAVHFLIAAAELHLRLHDWGKKRDARHNHMSSGPVQTQ